MNDDTIKELEENIREARKLVDAGTALERLRENRDFQKIVLEGYFRDEAIRLVHLKTDPNMQSDERQRSILTQMDGIGALNGYFSMVLHQSYMAKKGILADEEAIEDIMNEVED